MTDAKKEEKELQSRREEEKEEKEAEQWKEKYLRLAAEFDNYRKRIEREKEDLVMKTRIDLLDKFVEVEYEFSAALSHAEKSSKVEDVISAMKLIYQKITSVLFRENVSFIAPSKGEKFDHALHDAVTLVPTEEVPDGSVLELIKRGYRVGGIVAHPALVVVASRPHKEGEENSPSVSVREEKKT